MGIDPFDKDFFAKKDDRRLGMVRDYFPSGSGVIGAEIGVLIGDFSGVLYDELKPDELHLIDPWQKFAPPRTFTGDEAFEMVQNKFKYKKKKVELHRMTSLEALDKFEDEFFDFVYIDGDHRYVSVIADLKGWWPKVKPGGILAGDDYRHTRRGDGHTFGVVQAIGEFIHPDVMDEFHIIGDQFIIVKPS